MSRHPSTTVRIDNADLKEAIAVTGLEGRLAVRKLLGEAIAARRKPQTVEELGEAAIGAIRRMQEVAGDLECAWPSEQAEVSR